MRKFLVAGLAMGALALGAPAAQADHVGYAGPGCAFETVNDTTPGGQLGGENQWNGEASVLVVATDGAGTPANLPISVECELFVNGNSQGVFLSAEGANGVAAAADPTFSFTAADTDVVTVCDNVTVDGHALAPNCTDATTTQIVPQPVIDAINLLVDTLDTLVIGPLNPLVCAFLVTWRETFNNISPPNLWVDDDGDIYLFGTYRAHNCPPYWD